MLDQHEEAMEAAREIGNLKAEIARLRRLLERSTTDFMALSGENDRLRAALQPFADALAEGETVKGDTLDKLKGALMHISYGELKAARAALAHP